MGFECVTVWIKEVKGGTFAAVVPPFLDVGRSKAFDEVRETGGAGCESVMGVVGGGFVVAQRVEGKAEPQAGQGEVGARVPGRVELELQDGDTDDGSGEDAT